MAKKALITGITGQDGSYLTELLLGKGYEVYGIIRRASSFNTQRIDHVYKDPHEKDAKLKLVFGDLTDTSTVYNVLTQIKPDEVYNLGAQSHVGVSFDVPEYTANSVGLGAVRVLEAIHRLGLKTRYYQAGSSEMFGKVLETPQTEKTPFYPRSPYSAAKVYAHWITVNYRESYGMYTCNGILFNHETIASYMPMFCKPESEAEFDLKPISEIVGFDESHQAYQSKPVSNLQVWGKEGWVDVKHASAYPHDIRNDNKRPKFINARSGAFMATSSHVAFLENGIEKETGKIEVSDKLETIALPFPLTGQSILAREAELIGLMVGDGSISHAKAGIAVNAKFTNSSDKIRQHFNSLWSTVTGGTTVYYPTKSGFNPDKIVGQLRLVGGNDWLRRLDIYNKDRTKRVPKAILNSNPEIMLAFLKGYNMADGMKQNPCTYEFKNFKTNSATLAMGLWYLVERTTGQEINLTLETKADGRLFYSLNILSPNDNTVKQEIVRELVIEGVSQRAINRQTGVSRTFIRKIQKGGQAVATHHLSKPLPEVKKIVDLPEYEGWFYDLETSSGEFHCGVGKIHVHNSPRRGETFVTRKITRAVAQIKIGMQDKLYLGNLDSKRDWGYAKEYVEAMWLMLQQEKPDDFVIATGETHSVKEFLEEAFEYAELDWKKHVEFDKRYLRPAEVDVLIGDASKAKKKLGWTPKTTFKELVKIMVDADVEELDRKLKGKFDQAQEVS